MIMKSLPVQGVDRDFGRKVSQMLPLIMREFTRHQKNILSKGELNIPQIVVLEYLVERGICQMNELAKTLNLSMSAVTAIIDRMIYLKLVKREHSSEDRRVVNVTILTKGREQVRRVRAARRDCANSLFATLSEKDKNEYIRILRQVFNNLRQRQ
jgi:DNA-binding MarR family transcriptional regulator